MKRFTLILFIIASIVASASAKKPYGQITETDTYKFDVGVGLGMSGYLGDANESNLLKHPGFVADLMLRYLFEDNRWSLRAQLGMESISGDTSEWDNVLPGGAQYDFKSTVYDLSFRGEFNFFAYGIGETYKRLRRWSPFLSLGVGMCMSSGNGDTAVAFTIPMGFGVRYKISKRLNLTGEFTMTKAFGDKIDSKELTDLYQIKSSFIKNTDWFSTFLVSISYEFGPRCVTCHRID